MFIFKGRAFGAMAGIACAVLVTVLLGGCAAWQTADTQSVVDSIARSGVEARSVTDGPQVCERYGPRGDDRRCGTNQLYRAESMLNGMVR